jgi:hypothetical protein
MCFLFFSTSLSRGRPTQWTGTTRCVDVDRAKTCGYTVSATVLWPVQMTVSTTLVWGSSTNDLYEHGLTDANGQSSGSILSLCPAAYDAINALRGAAMPRKVMWASLSSSSPLLPENNGRRPFTHVKPGRLTAAINARIWSFAGEGVPLHVLLAALGIRDDHDDADAQLTVVLSDLAVLVFSRGDSVAW